MLGWRILSLLFQLELMLPQRETPFQLLLCLCNSPSQHRFDKGLIYARGYALGQEFRGKGVHVALGPMTNMGRVAAGGRNWEGFGADPYLSGWATEMTVRGIQDAGVQAW